jgi:hypothetical protein
MSATPPRTVTGANAAITFTDTSDWGTGFTGNIEIDNTSKTAINGWTLSFVLAEPISNIWNAQIISHTGNSYVVGNLSYNAAITAGGNISFGFQATGVSHSFSYFLIGALDMADRRKWEQALLSHYLSRLAHYGATPPAFDDAWLAYRQSALFGLFIFMCNEVAMQPEVNNTANAARFGHAVLDHDTFGALGV